MTPDLASSACKATASINRVAFVASRQVSVLQVWQRFMYSGHPVFQKAAADMHRDQPAVPPGPHSLPQQYTGSLSETDAFQTLIHWLYTRIPVRP